ncbi:MAG TPA: cytochrome d ubiquinol oxidase subunit II [Caulobacteraceae bacterium]|jgi:cytochrome d ubiquinol oxidase subunit II
MTLDLPLIWAGVLALAVLLYVMLDGFDLGIGILFPFAADAGERDTMMAAIAPVWDGNETWLVMGGGGLMIAFPTAYAILMPAFYLPVILMLMGLILRGVAFEFRLHGRGRGKAFWTAAFFGGSLVAALAQGFVLGGFIQGVKVADDSFIGQPFDWATPYTLVVALGLVAGYVLLGGGWLVIKTDGALHERARRWIQKAAVAVGVILAVVSMATLFIHPVVALRWGVGPQSGGALGVDQLRLLPLLPIPLMGLVGLMMAFFGARSREAHAHASLIGGFLAFISGYFGLAVGFMPFIVPYAVTYEQAASSPQALTLMLIGVAILLPFILGYSAWVYWIFRGKVVSGAPYH